LLEDGSAGLFIGTTRTFRCGRSSTQIQCLASRLAVWTCPGL